MAPARVPRDFGRRDSTDAVGQHCYITHRRYAYKNLGTQVRMSTRCSCSLAPLSCPVVQCIRHRFDRPASSTLSHAVPPIPPLAAFNIAPSAIGRVLSSTRSSFTLVLLESGSVGYVDMRVAVIPILTRPQCRFCRFAFFPNQTGPSLEFTQRIERMRMELSGLAVRHISDPAVQRHLIRRFSLPPTHS